MTEAEKTDDPEVAAAPRPVWHHWLFWVRAFVWLSLTPIFFAAAAGIVLLERDVSAPDWIVDRIEARAAELLNGGDLRFGEISLNVGRDLHPTVRLTDVQLRDANGTLISRVPVAEGLMSPRGLIIQREVLLQEIRVTGAQINLRRARDGSVAVAFGSGAPTTGQAESLAELLDQADALLERPQLEALEIVEAGGLIVNFDDARARRSWVVDGGNLTLDLRGGETALRGEFALLSGRAEVTTVNLSYRSPRGSRSAQLGLNISDAVASDIATQSPALSWLSDVDAPITAALRTELDSEGALGPLNGVLEIGAGALQPNPATQPVKFDAAKAYLTYDPARDRIAFSDISLETEWGRLRATGDAYLREFRDGLPQALLAQFRLTDVAVNPAELYDAPVTVAEAAVDVRLRFAPFAVDVGQLVLTDGPTRVSATGEVRATDAGWRVAMDASIDQSPVVDLLRYWPVSVKPRTRGWFEKNVTEGRIVDAVAGLRIAPDTPAQFATNFGFDGARVQFMRTMPPIDDGTGTVSIIGKRLVIALDDGIAAPPQGGQMQLAGSVFAIPEMGIPNPPAVLDLRIASSATAVLSVLNQRPFEFLDKANLPVTLVDGRARVDGRIEMPLKPRITNEEISFNMAADLTGVRSEVLVPGRRLAAPRMRVAADRGGLTVGGPVRVGDVPVDVVWSKAFGPEHAGQSRLQGEVELSERFLDEFGIALPPGSVRGAAKADLTIDLQTGTPPRFSLQSDMRGLGIGIAALSWDKAPGQTGELLVEGSLGPVPEIATLAIRAPGLEADGRVDLNADRQLEAARFERLQVDNWLDAAITLRGRGPGQPVGVEIDGGTVDLRRARFGPSQGQGGPVQIRLDRLQVSEGIALTGFQGDFNGAGGFSGQFSGQVNGATRVRGSVAPRNGRSAVRLVSDDAGGVARAAGFMRNGLGGSLDLTLLPAGGAGSFDGILAVRGLRVRDAPTMAALLDAISVVGLLQQLDGQGLSFDEIDARFRLTPAQVIVTEASAVGPGLGISVDGIYTLASKQLDLQGVVSPFYLVNSIGSVLTRRGEGLIGFNFNITGSANAPIVSVNPLSALTPGMFREIFRRPAPVIGQ